MNQGEPISEPGWTDGTQLGKAGEPSSNRGELGEPSNENRAQASPIEWASKILTTTFHFNPAVVLEGHKEKNSGIWKKNKTFSET